VVFLGMIALETYAFVSQISSTKTNTKADKVTLSSTRSFDVQPLFSNTPLADSNQYAEASDVENSPWVLAQYGNNVKVRVSNAKNIPEAFNAIWIEICRGEPVALLFPSCEEIPDMKAAETMLEHLEVCKDSCSSFGSDVTVVMEHPEKGNGAPCTIFEIQKIMAPPSIPTSPASSSSSSGVKQIGGFNFDFSADDDDDWDDWEIDTSKLLIDEDDSSTKKKQLITNDEILKATKDWNEAVICQMGICPFTTSATRAGLPLGEVHYPISHSTLSEEIYRDYWAQVALLIDSPPKKLSTTLMITPNFGLDNVEGFDAFSNSLTQPLEPLGLENHIQLVFFHPEYCFRDGQDRMGDAAAANYARRSPLPMINILRTNQVRIGQKGIPTGLVYTQNEKTLSEIGADNLQAMLDTCDWSGLAGKQVDRKSIPYFETARKVTEEYEQKFSTPLDDDLAQQAAAQGCPVHQTQVEVQSAPSQPTNDPAPKSPSAEIKSTKSDEEIVMNYLKNKGSSKDADKKAELNSVISAIDNLLEDLE